MNRRPSRDPKPGKHRYPLMSDSLRKRWQTPEYQAKQAAGRARRAEDQRKRPQHYSRLGVPNGWRKEEAAKFWAEAETLADLAIKGFERLGVVPEIVIPDSDEELAKLALRQTAKIAFGPSNDTFIKAKAANILLAYTRPKPEAKHRHLISSISAEDWLRTALAAGQSASSED
jgi:hypothetical protein